MFCIIFETNPLWFLTAVCIISSKFFISHRSSIVYMGSSPWRNNYTFVTRKPIYPYKRFLLFPPVFRPLFLKGSSRIIKYLRVGRGKQIYCCLVYFSSSKLTPRGPATMPSISPISVNIHRFTGTQYEKWR